MGKIKETKAMDEFLLKMCLMVMMKSMHFFGVRER